MCLSSVRGRVAPACRFPLGILGEASLRVGPATHRLPDRSPCTPKPPFLLQSGRCAVHLGGGKDPAGSARSLWHPGAQELQSHHPWSRAGVLLWTGGLKDRAHWERELRSRREIRGRRWGKSAQDRLPVAEAAGRPRSTLPRTAQQASAAGVLGGGSQCGRTQVDLQEGSGLRCSTACGCRVGTGGCWDSSAPRGQREGPASSGTS